MKKWILFSFIFTLPFAAFAAPDEQSDYTSYIGALEELNNKKFSKIIIKELNDYLHRFPSADNLDDIHFKIATLYSDRKDKVRSFFTNLEVIYLYPNSRHVPIAKDRVRVLLLQEKKFRPLKDKVETVLNPATRDSTTESAYFAFIGDMVLYDLKSIRKLTIAACEKFLQTNPEMPRADAVLFWQAQLLEKDKRAAEAIAELLQLTYLYSNSVFATASKLKMAEIFTGRLKMHDKAMFALEEFILEFPEDPQAPYAQFKLAQIIEKKKKKPLEALEAYKAVAKNFPGSVEAVPALFEAARLYEDKFKEYDQAIRIYTEVVRDFPEDIKAPHALAEAARIYEKRLKDYFNAANVFFKVYGHYPESNIAAESLFAAADINEKKLKDYDKAIMYYRFVVEQYPDKKVASKASKRIVKLSKNLANLK